MDEIAKQVKVLGAVPDGQSSIAGTHIVEEETQSVVDKYTYVYIQMYIKMQHRLHPDQCSHSPEPSLIDLLQ